MHNIVLKKSERAALWQSKKESHKAEHFIKWFTILFAIGVLVAVGIWWQKNKDSQAIDTPKESASGLSISETSSEIKLTDLSKMESLLTPNNAQMTPLEKNGG